MHYLHCILVELEETTSVENVEDLVEEARSEAIYATEYFQDQVYDWREEDAGRWADEFPNRGVVLGLNDRELFLKLLNKWREMPLRAALENLKNLELTEKPETTMHLSEKLIRLLWENNGPWVYLITSAVQLAYGRYCPDSCFYSVPDYSTKITQRTLKEATEHPERFALVFLDYHY
ncbi:hypothetical protein IT084_15775 [Desulfallas sp. Bu1-1]|uniref:hypothetical protein n=1 Tax=Desulfallas sp. Bu1-1 TaxID=2787620 RepID=UPI00189EDF26|nr:hypothetical protein [Desulfallas sp. Bu1-1]MBF7084412.1 hypothetical protein [Desulfallas sp. Bu1-1]